ncbi:MAG TPA: Ig-like domain-containing protein [Prolixibacteraceae bacterium]
MKKTFLLVISFCFTAFLFCNMVAAQAPTGVIAKATATPQIDGVVDAVWANATVYNIDKRLKTELPTLGTSGQTTWQALWDNNGVYILLKVTDDVFYPNYAVTPAGNNWEYDKPEIYFDVNDVLADGLGSKDNKGHIQVAPGFPQGKVDGTKNVQSDGIAYAFLVTGNNYIGEYFIPYTKLVDKVGFEVKKSNTIGFDVQIIDRDPGLTIRRGVWANVGAINESYNNMNDAGKVTFQDGPLPVYTTKITLNTGGKVTSDNGTLQMVPTIEPANADKKTMTWTVTNGTGIATISAAGVVTGVADGTVTVKAVATDGTLISATTDVVISGQVIDKNDVWNGYNLIKNWNFDTNLTSWSNWVDGNSQVAPAIVNGVCVMKVNRATDGAGWHYQFNQSGMMAAANVAYTLKFKSWANVDGTPCIVDFEDIAANGNKRYGTSTDAGNVGGASEWNYKVSTTPTWFTYHVVFDKMVANTVQKLQWMNSLSLATISLDSVLLIKDSEMPVFIDKITLNTGGTISTNGGTLQMVATALPANATFKEMKWSVSPEGLATISSTGLLTAVTNGTVTVKAVATDGTMKAASVDVVITKQVKDYFNKFNLIKNWNFDTDMVSWGGWVDGGVAGQLAPVSKDGVCVMKVSKASDGANWHYQHSQSPLAAEANIGYTLKFKSWASVDGTPCAVDFESGSSITPANGGDQYARYGTTTDPESADGKSEWSYKINMTPTWYTFHVTFDKMIATTIQKVQWMASLSNATIYLDSVILIKDSELAIRANKITLNTGGTITTDGGALQLSASFEPENVTNQELNWSLSPEGIATISPTGLVRGVTNGTVTVKAVTMDGSLKTAMATVVITGQVDEKALWSSSDNLIKNWNFNTDLTSWGGWVDTAPAGMVAPVVIDGVCVMKVSKSADAWHYQHSQSPLSAEANVGYTLKFKSWASADGTPCAVDFEDTPANSYNRYGITTDAESADGRSEWHYNVNVIPTWYTFHVTFDKMVPTTVQKLQWMNSLSNETLYLDSVILIKDSALPVMVSPIANAGNDQSVKELALVTLDASMSVDPNGNVLNYRWIAPAGITLSSATDKNPSFTAPEITADKIYNFSLVVGYGTVSSTADQVAVKVKQVNKVPVANAGVDQSVNEGATVTLSGSGTDADGVVATYLWTGPASIALSSTTAKSPTFTAPNVNVDRSYTFYLEVNDGMDYSVVDQVVVMVKQVDKAPYLLNKIQNYSVDKGSSDQVVDLKTIFADYDFLDEISYTVTNTNTQVVTTKIALDILTLSFSKLNNGTADLVVTGISNGKEVKATFTVEVKIPTGVNSIANEASFQIYPNPTKGKLQLKFSQSPKAGTMITVYNHSGQEVLKTVASDMIVNLDLSGKPAGMYFIKLDQKMFKLILE